MNKRLFNLVLLVMCCLSLHVQAFDNVVLYWNRVSLEAIKVTNTSPPVAARALAIIHTSMFDAWSHYDPYAISTRLGAAFKRPVLEQTQANKAKAISYAAFRALNDLFPPQESTFLFFFNALGYDASDITLDPTTASGIGNLSAFEVLAFRHLDGSNQLGNELASNGTPYSDYTNYTPLNTVEVFSHPSNWQPLLISDKPQTFLLPHWGQVIPFALTSGSQFIPPPPAKYPSRRYTSQAEDVIGLSARLNDRAKMITEYWADEAGTVTPPGHWNEIAQFVAERDGQTIDESVKLFFALNNALLDASIAAWWTKRFYDSVRPFCAIRLLFKDQLILSWGGPSHRTTLINGATWQPYLSTPPFGEYISGHSTFSHAAAEVLQLFTGNDAYRHSITFLKGSSFIEPGLTPSKTITLSWKTFSQAAAQAGLSRRLGGIHFEEGDLEGRKLGRLIGELAFRKASVYMGIP